MEADDTARTKAPSAPAPTRPSPAPKTLGEAIVGTSLWEAAYDEDPALLEAAAAAAGARISAEEQSEDDEEEEDKDADKAPAPEGESLHYVTVDKTAKLYIRVRVDDDAGTCVVTHFDHAPSGRPGPVEASGEVQVGDFLVRVDDAPTQGMAVREVMALIRSADDDSVILTFLRRPKQPRQQPQPQQHGQQPLHLTEENRVLIIRHLLQGDAHGIIPAGRLGFFAGNGLPDSDKSLRPLVWRILLGYLPYDRSKWPRHLEEQRTIYGQFVRDLTILPEDEPTAAAAVAAAAKETEADSSAGGSGSGPAASRPSSSSPGRAKLVPSSSPRRHSSSSSSSSSFSFDSMLLDVSSSFTGVAREPVRRRHQRAASNSDSTATACATDGTTRDRRSSSILGASAAGSQPHFAASRPRTRPRFQTDRELWDEIKKDVVRTHADQQFFLDPQRGRERYEALLRGLFIYAKVNPAVRYVQGMNEVFGTLFFVLASDPDAHDVGGTAAAAAAAAAAEADAFFCFTQLMGRLRDLFIAHFDATESGIGGKIEQLEALLRRHDRRLHDHLRAQGVQAHFFALRWITTLFSREFNLADTIRIWDSLFAAASDAAAADLVLFVALAMLVEVRDALLMGDFAHNLKLLQNYPPCDVRHLLGRAAALRNYDSRLARGGQRAEESQEDREGGLGSPGARLKAALQRVASQIEELEVPAALDSVAASLSVEGRRAGSQLRASLSTMTRRLVENLAERTRDQRSMLLAGPEGKVGKGTEAAAAAEAATAEKAPPPGAGEVKGDR